MTSPLFQFPQELQEDLKKALQSYFLDEMDMEIGDLKTENFIAFLNERIGKYYYNLGVTNTMETMKDKVDDLVLLLKD